MGVYWPLDQSKKPLLRAVTAFSLEARAGVEPTYTDLQSGA
jgi:hypothetical protein